MATRKETRKRKTAFVQQLRREYKNGELLPGEMLPPVRALASKYGLSKRVVNEELQKLATEGWLRTVPRKGIFVSEDAGASRRFLDHAVVVLSAAEQPTPSHRQGGWLDHVAYGALKEIHVRGLHAIVLHPDRLCAEVLERLAPEQPYGVVIPEMDEALVEQYGAVLRKSGVRVVMNGDSPVVATYDRVTSNHETGAYELTKWLISQGRQQIRLVWTIAPTAYWCAQRQRGYERAMKEAKLRPLAAIELTGVGDITEERSLKIERIAAQLKLYFRDGRAALEALLTPSDGTVAEIDAAVRTLDKTPGRDVLICGYDAYWQDLEACGFESAHPAATVDKLNAEQGAEMVRLLLERAAQVEVAGESPRILRREVTPRLVVVENKR